MSRINETFLGTFVIETTRDSARSVEGMIEKLRNDPPFINVIRADVQGTYSYRSGDVASIEQHQAPKGHSREVRSDS